MQQKLPTSRRGKVLLASVVGLVLAMLVGAAVWVRAGLPDGAAFGYGDRVVTIDELDRRARSLKALYGVEAPTDPAKIDGFRRDLAKSVAVGMILDEAASERGIVIAGKQARDVLDRYITAQFGDGGREAFVQSLGNVGTSEREVLDEIKRQLAVGRLMEQVVGKASIGDDRLRGAFAKRKAELGVPERRVVRNIVLGSEHEAKDVLGRLRAGADIKRIAAEYSLDASTKQSGGLLGELTREQLEGPVGDAVFETSAHKAYGPVKGEFGWNVGRVDRVLPPEPAEFGAVRDSLRETLRAEESLDRWRDWLAERIRAAEVDYAPDYLPADPDAPPAVNAPGPPSARAPR